MFRNLLVYKLIILNSLMALVLGKLYQDGHVGAILAGDTTGISVLIATLFAATTGWVFMKSVGVSIGLNQLKRREWIPFGDVEERAIRDMGKIGWLEVVSLTLVGLGLLGTLWGFSVALSGIDKDIVDVNQVKGAVGTLVQGMRIAINTTIVGAFFGMWHDANRRMLLTSMTCLWSERREQSWIIATTRRVK